MSEVNENTGVVETPGTGTGAASWLNAAIESVMDLIDALGNYATITRGALGIGNGICCEIAPSSAQEVYLDKNAYFSITLALNAKHNDLQTVSDTLNGIMDSLTRRTEYPTGTGFQIVDITNVMMPHVIGRDDKNLWLMACDIGIQIYRKDE